MLGLEPRQHGALAGQFDEAHERIAARSAALGFQHAARPRYQRQVEGFRASTQPLQRALEADRRIGRQPAPEGKKGRTVLRRAAGGRQPAQQRRALIRSVPHHDALIGRR